MQTYVEYCKHQALCDQTNKETISALTDIVKDQFIDEVLYFNDVDGQTSSELMYSSEEFPFRNSNNISIHERSPTPCYDSDETLFSPPKSLSPLSYVDEDDYSFPVIDDCSPGPSNLPIDDRSPNLSFNSENDNNIIIGYCAFPSVNLGYVYSI